MVDEKTLIRTKRFVMTREEFTRVNTLLYFRMQGPKLVGGFLILVCVLLLDFWWLSGGQWGKMVVALIVVVLYFLFVNGVNVPRIFWRRANRMELAYTFNRMYFYEFGDNFMTVYYDDGSMSRILLAHISKVIKRNNYYLLLNACGASYLPLRAFESDEDRQRFESLLVDKGIKIVHKK